MIKIKEQKASFRTIYIVLSHLFNEIRNAYNIFVYVQKIFGKIHNKFHNDDMEGGCENALYIGSFCAI